VTRIAIVGSRHYPDLDRVGRYVRGLPVRVLGASFEEARDAEAAASRNRRLVELCDVLVAFWDGTSEGTRRTVERALDSGREVHVFPPGPAAPPGAPSP